MRAFPKESAVERVGHVYTDRHVIAAYTDRPTYRPGQEVRFKLIVRRLAPEKAAAADRDKQSFRAEDFDIRSKLMLPDEGIEVNYAVLDPSGREMGLGILKLNDYGTAAGKVELNSETATGVYSLRVYVGGMYRIVPEVFAVKYYRRPTFELKVEGVPEKLKKPATLKLALTGQYYFGKPVAGGKVDARLVRTDAWKPLAEVAAELNGAGNTNVELEMPPNLHPGKYIVMCTLTDDSGRSVSKSMPCEMEGTEPRRTATGLDTLPRFVPAGKPFEVSTAAEEITAGQHEKPILHFEAKKGRGSITLPVTGWYTLTAGDETTEIFAYGGFDDPFDTFPKEKARQEAERTTGSSWVSLTDYRSEEDGEPRRGDWDDRQEDHLLALFDRHHSAVGENLRILVYTPYKRARLLFTIEGRTVIDYFITQTSATDSAYHIIEIPIKERYLPNFYLQGRILAAVEGERTRMRLKDQKRGEKRKDADDGSEDPRWCRVDVVDLNHEAGAEQLKVQIKTDRPVFRPGEAVKVEMKVTDRQGQPRASEVSLSAVDESVYTFGEEKIAHLAQLFNAPHVEQRYMPKSWRSSRGNRWKIEMQEKLVEQLARLVQQDAVEELQRAEQSLEAPQATHLLLADTSQTLAALASLHGELPATNIPLARLRTDFRETATWQPQLRAGPDGLINTSFKLPDSLTQYRLSTVAVTKGPDIGTGRTDLRVSMPLAVQLFLPHFAVEKDRLLAVGLIHNNTAQERICDVSWEIHNAIVDSVTPPLAVSHDINAKTVAQGQITIPANGTARAGLWLVMEHAGTTKVTFRAGDKDDADAEVRTMPVHPLGRTREVDLKDTLPIVQRIAGGGSIRQTRLNLPDGFVANDLHINLSCMDVAQSLEGLGYLVEYPYGCTEQTMSRFLPAVMVKHAAQQAPINLPPDVAAKLPDVLAKGLTRLYNFQHADGGWGWWERDTTNLPMTAYVVYGLARCQSTGTTVDRNVLQRGCGYLKEELKKGIVDHDLAARVWLALALAGEADSQWLASYAQRSAGRESLPGSLLQRSPGLPFRGFAQLGERLHAAARSWQPTNAEDLALKLKTQLAFGASFKDCKETAHNLLSQPPATAGTTPRPRPGPLNPCRKCWLTFPTAR